MAMDGEKNKIKVVVLDNINKFVVENVFIWFCLWIQILISKLGIVARRGMCETASRGFEPQPHTCA
jgi:hypothetical protein